MYKSLQKSFEFKSKNIDSDKGIIYGVSIINRGVDSHGDYITEDNLEQVVKFGNSTTKGVGSRFGHPSYTDSTPSGIIARCKNFSRDNQRVTADYYLQERIKNIRLPNSDIDLWTHILDTAKNDSDILAISITGKWQFLGYVNKQGEVDENSDLNRYGKYNIKELRYCDLVNEGACNRSLFKSENTNEDKRIKDLEKRLYQLEKDNHKMKLYINTIINKTNIQF